jgi:hypothetical protein
MKTKTRPPREYEIKARVQAFVGARLVLNEGKSISEAVAAADTKSSSVSEALTILIHGTPEEALAVQRGEVSLGKTADAVRDRVPQSERDAKRRPPTRSVAMVGAIEFDASIWGGLRDALDAIIGLPSPKDTAVIVRKNNMRLEHINRKLLVALEWIQEFSNEITL